MKTISNKIKDVIITMFTDPNSVKGLEHRIKLMRNEVEKGKITKEQAEYYIKYYLEPQIKRKKEAK